MKNPVRKAYLYGMVAVILSNSTIRMEFVNWAMISINVFFLMRSIVGTTYYSVLGHKYSYSDKRLNILALTTMVLVHINTFVLLWLYILKN